MFTKHVHTIIENIIKNIRSITDVIYQNPGGFSGKDSPLFFSNPTTTEKNLANRVLRGEYFYPATLFGVFVEEIAVL